MITISKTIKTFVEEVNNDNSNTLAFFERITSILFKGTCLLGVPLLLFMIYKLYNGL